MNLVDEVYSHLHSSAKLSDVAATEFVQTSINQQYPFPHKILTSRQIQLIRQQIVDQEMLYPDYLPAPIKRSAKEKNEDQCAIHLKKNLP